MSANDIHGDPLPKGATARLGTRRFRGGAHFTGGLLRWFGPEHLFACGRTEIRVLDLRGRCVRQHPIDELHGIAASSNGQTLAVITGSFPGRLELWDANTFTVQETIAKDLKHPLSARFSADDSQLAVRCYEGWRHFHLRGGEPDTTWAPEDDGDEISPDGRHIARILQRSGYLEAFEVTDAQTQDRLPCPDGAEAGIYTVAFCNDGSVFTHSVDWIAAVWAPDGRLRWKTDHTARSASYDATADVVLTSDGYQSPITVLHPQTGEHLRTLSEMGLPQGDVPTLGGTLIKGIHGRPDTTRIVTAYGTVLAAGPDAIGGHHADVRAGRVVNRSSSAHIYDLNAPGLPRIGAYKTLRTSSAALSADGSILYTGGQTGTLTARDAVSGKKLWKKKICSERLGAARVSPDGKRLALGSRNGTVRVVSLDTRKTIHAFEGHEGRVLSVAFSNDGARLVSGSTDTTALIWAL